MQKINRINPIAKAIAHSRRRTSTRVVPDKTKYNRKKLNKVAPPLIHNNNLDNIER